MYIRVAEYGRVKSQFGTPKFSSTQANVKLASHKAMPNRISVKRPRARRF